MDKVRLWLPLSLLAVAVVAAVALHYAWRPAPTPTLAPSAPTVAPIAVSAALDGPEAEAAPAALLAQKYRDHHIDVKTARRPNGDPADAYLLFDGAPDLSRLKEAPQTPEQAGRWKGVILSRFCPDRRLDDVVLAAWGDCGMRTGPYLLFGDPEWIAHSRQVLPPT